LWLNRSWTTRPRRPGEPDDAYEFVGRQEFEARARAGGFLEWATVLDELYGSPWPEPPSGRDVVLEIDVEGARQVTERCGGEVVCVLLLPPSRDVEAARLRARGETEATIARRLELGSQEELLGRKLAHHVVVNDEIERAVEDLGAIIATERKARAR
jgi:guanylate kinase